MIVDAHVHVLDYGHWPAEWWDWVANDWASKESGRIPADVRHRIEDGLVDPTGDRCISHMNESGIDVAVLLPIDWGPDYNAAKSVDEINSHAIEMTERHPGRFIPFAGIDPRRPGAADRLDAWLASGLHKGLKLYPSCGFFPADKAAFELYEVCVAHDVPVLFHTGQPLPLLDIEYSRPKYFFDVAKAFPTLRMWLAHAGEPDEWDDALEVAASSKEACLELSVLVWDDSTDEDELRMVRRIAEARDRIGIHRIIFGTDHVSGSRIRPRGFMPTVTEMFKRLPETARRAGVKLSEEEHALIMGRNALSQLRISSHAGN